MPKTFSDLDPSLQQRIIDRRFWKQVEKDFPWDDTSFCQQLFAESYEDMLPPRLLAMATSTIKDDLWRKKRQPQRGIPDIGSCVQTFTPGELPSHRVIVTIKKQKHEVILPSVKVEIDNKQYITMIENAPSKDKEFIRVYARVLMYCYRLGLPTATVVAAAMDKVKWKMETHQRMQENAKKHSYLVRTTDQYLADWFLRVSEYCITLKQVQILVDVYAWAAKHNSKQPRINKLAVADRVGCSRKSIINLFNKLESKGLLIQQPEQGAYVSSLGRPNSEARIINLDPDQRNRWENYESVGTITRCSNRTFEKRRKLAWIRNNGYWITSVSITGLALSD